MICEICLGVLNKPRHLGCLHSFCSECILNMLSVKNSEDTNGNEYISCPVCFKITLFDGKSPYEFVSKIQKNYQLEKMCELVKDSMELYTDSSINKNTLEKKNHSNVNSTDNKLCTIIDNGNDEPFKYCKFHGKNILKYFCKSCDDLLCRVCEIVGHRDHKIVDIDDVYKEQEKILFKLLETNKNNKILLQNSIQEVNATLTNLRQCEQDISDKINESVKERIDEIKSMANQLKQQLNKCIRLKMKKLDVQKDSLEMELEKMSFIEIFAEKSLSFNNPVNVLSVKLHLKKLCNEFQKVRLEPEEDDSIIYNKNNHPLSSINIIGDIEVFSTYAELSFASGDGIKSAIVNETQYFQVITMDRFGNSVAINKNLKIKISSPNNYLLDSNIIIDDRHDGSYMISYTPKIAGKHTIDVTIGDIAIKGSPFIVNAFAKRDYSIEKHAIPVKIGAYGTKPKEFKSPLGITTNDKQEIFICDSYNHRIQVLSKRGEQLGLFGSHGQKLGCFSCPSGIDANKTESLIAVSELSNHRIQLLKRESIVSTGERETFILKPKTFFGREGCDLGFFRAPMGLCFNNFGDQIYVCDRDNARVQYLSIEGFFIDFFISNLQKPMQPVYATCEPFSNVLFVSDVKNSVILSYDSRTGSKPISVISQLFNSQINTLFQPKGVTFDLCGNLVVSDAGNGRVIVMKTDGNVVTEFPQTKNSSNNLFKSPEDISVLSCGRLVATDILNHQFILF